MVHTDCLKPYLGPPLKSWISDELDDRDRESQEENVDKRKKVKRGAENRQPGDKERVDGENGEDGEISAEHKEKKKETSTEHKQNK